jgi:hypothetical protein
MVTVRFAAQFVINQGQQLRRGFVVASLCSIEDLRAPAHQHGKF